jgi:two-component system response regulator RegA
MDNLNGTIEPQPVPDAAQMADRTVLIVDPDHATRARLTRYMERKGYRVVITETVNEATAYISRHAPAFAIVELRLPDGGGLDVIQRLNNVRPNARSIILTGFGNITTAVAAIKAGATDYLAKPSTDEDIENALTSDREELPPPPENPMSADRVRWEHIQRVYELCQHNVSETARRLGMHRRTLQRILAKRAPN